MPRMSKKNKIEWDTRLNGTSISMRMAGSVTTSSVEIVIAAVSRASVP